jgi:hypothetical protein
LLFASPTVSRPAWMSPREFRTEALAELVVDVALIPEAISFHLGVNDDMSALVDRFVGRLPAGHS